MKMFVWTGVLEDYTSGIVCVLANDLDEALKTIIETAKSDGDYHSIAWGLLHNHLYSGMQHIGDEWIYPTLEELKAKQTFPPDIYEIPTLVGVYGGG